MEAEWLKKRTPLWREASKGQKQLSIGVLEVVMLKKRTTLWREAHVEVKTKKKQCRKIFGRRAVQKVHTVVARSTLRSQNVQSTPRSEHLWS